MEPTHMDTVNARLTELKLHTDFNARSMSELLSRLTRIESRMVMLMKHTGMQNDGRHPFPQTLPNGATR